MLDKDVEKANCFTYLLNCHINSNYFLFKQNLILKAGLAVESCVCHVIFHSNENNYFML